MNFVGWKSPDISQLPHVAALFRSRVTENDMPCRFIDKKAERLWVKMIVEEHGLNEQLLSVVSRMNGN